MCRMCKELEDIGLPDPVFNNSTFILKTTVMSATYQKLPFEKEKVSDSDIITKAREKYRPIKLSLEAYTQAYTEKSYNTSTILNLQAIYDQIEVNRVFNSTYLMKILNCPDRGARRLLIKLKEMNVVVVVSGKGKGMYRLKYDGEK